MKPKLKLYRMADAHGLCIEVQPNGGRYWRFRYRYAGKAKMLSFGVYPAVTLANARLEQERARALLRSGVDPSAKRRQDEESRRISAANTFESIALEWLAQQQGQLALVTYQKAVWMLNEFAFPSLGSRPIRDIAPSDLLAALRRVEARGKLETTHRLKQRCSQVFRYAIATGRADRDPCPDLRGALATPKVRHRASITEPKELADLRRSLRDYKGSMVTACALQLAPLVARRRRRPWQSTRSTDSRSHSCPRDRLA